MGRPHNDKSGERYGSLTVVSRYGHDLPVKFICRCDCGNEVVRYSQNLRTDVISACDACNAERIAQQCRDFHKVRFDLNFFLPQNMSTELAYWLGFIGGDGNVYRNILSIISTDEEIPINFISACSGDQKIVAYTPADKKPYWVIRIQNAELCDILSYYGITPRKSLTFEPRNIPDEYLLHFVRGYFDANGTMLFYRSPRRINCAMRIYTGSMAMVNWWNDNVPFHLSTSRVAGRSTIMVGTGSMGQAVRMGRWMYSESTVTTRLVRKYATWKRLESYFMTGVYYEE